MMLESLRRRLQLLNSFRRASDSVMTYIAASFSPCTVLLHLVFQFSLIVLVCLCFSAEGLIVSLCHRSRGRNFLSEVVMAAALFASLSALSLPSIPVCVTVVDTDPLSGYDDLGACQDIGYRQVEGEEVTCLD